MIVYDFLKTIMERSSCYYAVFVGNCHSVLRSEVKEIVAAVHVKQTKCLEKNSTNIINISITSRIQFVLLLMFCFVV